MKMRSSGAMAGGVANVLRFGIGDVAGKGEDEAEIERGAGVIDGAGEAVQHAGEAAGGPMLANQAQHIVPGVLAVVGRAAVNDDGQLGGLCHLHLLNEDALLHVAWRVIVEVVESDLAPGDDLGIARQTFEFVEVRWRGELGFMRMNADRRVDASRIAERV